MFRLSPVNALNAENKVLNFLLKGEEIHSVFQTVHSHVFFTNKRIITAGFQHRDDEAPDYFSIPYSKNRWSLGA